MRSLNVLFAVHDWGLGHATRDLVLIRGLLDAGHAVTVISHGRALKLLEEEVGDRCEALIELGDIPKPLSRRPFWFYVRMSLSMPKVFSIFRHERELTEKLVRERRFDRVISDSRYGVVSKEVPSYYLLHSLRQIIPGRPRLLEKFVECQQESILGDAVGILIPDEAHDGLAGELSHDPVCDWHGRLRYIGILSSVRRLGIEKDLDYFVSVSGAEPQRTYFEELVLSQAHDLPGRVVVALGRSDGPPTVQDDGHVRIHSYLDRRAQEEMMNRARLVISRSGYTTLMELTEVRGRALFVPTVGQSEQEYLAAYHEGLGHAYFVPQPELRLGRDVEKAEAYAGLPPLPPTRTSVARFLDLVTAGGAPELPAQQEGGQAAQNPY